MTFEESWLNVNRVLQDTFKLDNRRIAWLSDVRDQVRQLASLGISTAPDFTLHNETHSDNVVLLIGRLAEHFKSQLSGHELYLLAASAYLHDVGMFFSEADFVDRILPNLGETLKFCPQDSCDSGAAYQESLLGKSVDAQIRIVHHLLSAFRILEEGRELFRLASPEEINDVITICRGHRKANLRSRGCDCYKTRPTRFGQVQLGLLAGLLRLADGLDFYPERTPEGVFRTRAPDLLKNPVALKHWLTHIFAEAVYISIENQGGNRCLDLQIHMAVDTRRTLNGRTYREFFAPLFDEFLKEAQSSDFDAEQYPSSLLKLFDIEDIQLTQHIREGVALDKLPDKIVKEIERSGCRDVLEFLSYLESERDQIPDESVARPVHGPKQRTFPGMLYDTLMDRRAEVETFECMVDGDDPQHCVMLMVGGYGQGKSWLIRTFQQMATERQIPCLMFDLGEALEFDAILDGIWRHLGPHHFLAYSARRRREGQFEQQSAEMRREELTKCFFADWEALGEKPRLVLLFDTYERAAPTLQDWIEDAFLAQLKRIERVIVVIGGREWPAMNGRWWKHGYAFPLEGVRLDDYKAYAEQRGVPIPSEDLVQLYRQMEGLPKLFAEYVDGLAQVGV